MLRHGPSFINITAIERKRETAREKPDVQKLNMIAFAQKWQSEANGRKMKCLRENADLLLNTPLPLLLPGFRLNQN